MQDLLQNNVAIVVGGSGGIGGPLLARLLADPSVNRVFATSTREVCSTHPKLRWLRLDFTDESTITRAADAIKRAADRVDLMVVASGHLHDFQNRPEKRLTAVSIAGLETNYRRNASGPLALFAQLSPLLQRTSNPRVLFLSAQVGSIADNRLGGWYGYRMAKAALNMGVKTAAIEARRWRNGAAVVAVHPGTTATQLAKPFLARRKVAPRTPEQTARLLTTLLAQIEESHNGAFLTADAAPLPW